MTTREAINKNIFIGLSEKDAAHPDDTRSPRVDHKHFDSRNPGRDRQNLLDRYKHVTDELRRDPRRWPLVHIYPPGASQDSRPKRVLCVPNVFEANDSRGRVEATREQVNCFQVS